MPFSNSTNPSTATGRKTWVPFSPDTASNPLFIDAEAWNAINMYVITGTFLPATMKEDDIKDAYALIRQHTIQWRDVTFAKTVTVADDIVDYAGKAPTYLSSLDVKCKALEVMSDSDPGYATALKTILTLITRLTSEADAHAANARKVKELVLAFQAETTADQTSILSVYAKYNGLYGASGTKVAEINADIDKLRDEARILNDEYNHAVVVAATTPTYFFTIPVGTIAAIVVAGIYGDKAVKLKEKIDLANAHIARLQGDLAVKVLLVATLKMAKDSLSDIKALMPPALLGLEKVSRCWTAISSDLGALKTAVENLHGSFDFIIDDVPVISEQWRQAGIKADAYRAHAFCTVAPSTAAAA